jgi:hypothetical protein
MLFLKFICAIIAIFSTTLYISSLLTSISFNAFRFPSNDDHTEDITKAKFRIITGIIMAVTWAVLIVF